MEKTYYINYFEDSIRKVDTLTYHMFVTTLSDQRVSYRELITSDFIILVVLPK